MLFITTNSTTCLTSKPPKPLYKISVAVISDATEWFSIYLLKPNSKSASIQARKCWGNPERSCCFNASRSHVVYATKSGKTRLYQVKLLPPTPGSGKQKTAMTTEQRRQFLTELREKRQKKLIRPCPNRHPSKTTRHHNPWFPATFNAKRASRFNFSAVQFEKSPHRL